jgi:hypothetical protein
MEYARCIVLKDVGGMKAIHLIVCIQQQLQEEEMHASRTPYQGQGKSSQGQGNEVATSGIAVCFDCTLSVQIKQQASTHGLSSVRASALEVEGKKGWIRLCHFKTEAFHPRQFLCG